MKNQVYTSVAVLVVSCVLGLPLYTVESNVDNSGVTYDLSDSELVAAKDECKAIGLEHAMQGENFNILVYECFIKGSTNIRS